MPSLPGSLGPEVLFGGLGLQPRSWSVAGKFPFWIVALSDVAGIILFTQFWPQYHKFTLMAGALIALPLLALYGRSRKRAQLLSAKASDPLTYTAGAAYKVRGDSRLAEWFRTGRACPAPYTLSM
jgi:hypothetical protein